MVAVPIKIRVSQRRVCLLALMILAGWSMIAGSESKLWAQAPSSPMPDYRTPADGNQHAPFEVQSSQIQYRYGPDYRQYAVQPVSAQEEVQPAEEVVPLPLVENEYGELVLDNVCAGCGGGGGCGGCGGSGCGGCLGGCQTCGPSLTAKTRYGRFMQAVYHGMCCPDPCYEPMWRPIADSSFMASAARPVTQTRLRWDAGFVMTRPDISEFYWARADGAGLGPAPPAGSLGTRFLDFQEIKLYNEVALHGFGVIMEMPYRSLDIDGQERVGGFSDMMIGTKSLMMDTELVQWSLIIRTHIPIGLARNGLGVGHTAIEPAIAMGINLSPNTTIQAEVAERIPIAGNPEYAGGVLQYHLSFNHELFRPEPSMPVIGTFEISGYTFHEGAYTDPVLGTQLADGATYISAGPGLRVFFCNRMDFGLGTSFALTKEHLAEYLLRSEFRMRF